MTIKNLILDWLDTFDIPIVDFSTSEAYAAFPLLNRSSIRSAISRMKKDGQLVTVERGIYEIESKQYQLYSHSKRIKDTNSIKKKKHSYDIDIEMTIEGTANRALSHDQIDAVVNPVLVDRSLELLSEEGILLLEATTNFQVEGSEWKYDKLYKYYEPTWAVEVKMVNNVGAHYTFAGTVEINENEF